MPTYWGDLVTSSPPSYLPTQAHTPPRPHTSSSSLFQFHSLLSPPPPSFFIKAPVLANLSIRCCPVVAMMGVRDGVPHTSCSSASSSMINQAGTESNCWQHKHTDSWFERQCSHSLHLTCHGSQSTFSLNLWHIRQRWRETLIYSITLINGHT